MDTTTNTGIAVHARRHGLARMPAFANLAAVTHFHRTRPHVSGRLLSTSVSLLSSFATRSSPYNESHPEGRRSSPTLPIAPGRRSAQPYTDVKIVDSNRISSQDSLLSTSKSSSTKSCDSAYSPAHETSHTADRNPPQANSRHYDSSTANTQLAPAVNADFPDRRTHTIVYGRLIPVVIRPGRSLGSNGQNLAAPRNTLTNATIAVGARPLLHTAQDFPFDLRRSQVEAGRVSGAPLESEWDLPARSSSRLTG